jgi:hypothetical protein
LHHKNNLPSSTEFNSKDQCCLIIGKNSNTTNLTIGHYAGLMLFTHNESIESIKLSIYNSGFKIAATFFARKIQALLFKAVYKCTCKYTQILSASTCASKIETWICMSSDVQAQA